MSDMLLSCRLQVPKKTSGQTGHDFFKRPGYADPEKTGLNKTLYGGSVADIQSRIEEQSARIVKQYNENQERNRAAITFDSLNLSNDDKQNLTKKEKKALLGAEKRKISSWRKNTSTHKTAIVTFNKEFRKQELNGNIDNEKLDQCAMNFFNDFCKKHGCELSYVVRHNDETTPHYHATFTNLNAAAMKVLRFEKRDTSALQDFAGERFRPLNIHRGIKKGDRLEIARLNNPRHEDESDDDYEKRVYKLANVQHRNVGQLHDDMPRELAEKQAEIDNTKAELDSLKTKLSNQEGFFEERISELEDVVLSLQTKIEKVNKNINVAETKLKNTWDEDVTVTNKIEKNITTYNRRYANLNNELDSSQAELEKVKALVSDEKEELKELVKKPLKLDIAKSYEVVIKKSILGKETKKMSLVTPVKYKSAIKQLREKQKFNDNRHNSLNERSDKLKNLEKLLKRDRSKFNELVDERVEKHINDHAVSIKERVIADSKALVRDAIDEVVSYEKRLDMSNETLDKINAVLDRSVEDKINENTYENTYENDDGSLLP